MIFGNEKNETKKIKDEASGISEKNADKSENHKKDEMINLTRSLRNSIMAIMTVTIIVAVVFTGLVLVKWGNDRIEREVDSYNYQLENWTNTQLQTMNMFVDTIAANPSVLDDYDFAVEYLDRIVGHYPEISAAYIARPDNEHEMTMNNGWIPNADYIVAERQWYVDTVESPMKMNISTPYIDARTGLYCVTFSRVIYNTETGEQIGVFALDFYIENLTSIMESSYSEHGYAFLVDNSAVIVNHPNKEYQISDSKSTNVINTEYEKLLDNSGAHFIWDYDGKLKVCLSRTEIMTGFTVISVKNASAVYGTVLFSGIVFILLLIACVVLLYKLIIKLICWQEEVRTSLAEQAQRADAASRAKNNFLANMSHEIRTPMNAVVGMTELILRESDISNIVRDYCYQIKNSSKNLLSIINDILDFSKIESGKMDIIEDNFNFASTLNDISNMAVVRIGEKPLEFINLIESNVPMGLIGDELRLRQVIINIVNNAIKYSEEGCVVLKIYLDSNSIGEKMTELAVEVIDTGIGISESDMEKLFDSFHQVDTKKNHNIEGTGLGLAISKCLINQMGGTLTVSSTYGKGSAFKFKIPLKVSDETPFLQVKNAQSIHAALYANLDRYIRTETKEYLKRNFESLGRVLDIDIECYYSFSELKERMKEKNFTHIITSAADYITDEAFFDEVPDLIILQERNDTVPNISGKKRVCEPFSALSFAAVFNDEQLIDMSGGRKFVAKFIAPEAHILIVDDNAVNLQVAKGLMKPYKMQIDTAVNGPEAIKRLQTKKNYDIVFMDHMMPGMDGVEATKIIRELPDEYFKNVCIIALTANVVLGAREMFIASGMNGFLAKPIEVTSLNNILRNFLPKSYIRKSSAVAESIVTAPVPEGDDEFSPKKGLFYSGENLEAYHNVLKIYIANGKTKLDSISSLYAQKDWKNYIIEVHALKSTSLTIGAKKLSELAKELEFAGKEGNIAKITEKTDEMLSLYRKVLDSAGKYLSENTKPEEIPSTEELTAASDEQVKEWVERIITACDDMNIAEIKEICGKTAEYSYNGKPLKIMFDKVLTSAEEFEFDEASFKAKSILTEK